MIDFFLNAKSSKIPVVLKISYKKLLYLTPLIRKLSNEILLYAKLSIENYIHIFLQKNLL